MHLEVIHKETEGIPLLVINTIFTDVLHSYECLRHDPHTPVRGQNVMPNN